MKNYYEIYKYYLLPLLMGKQYSALPITHYPMALSAYWRLLESQKHETEQKQKEKQQPEAFTSYIKPFATTFIEICICVFRTCPHTHIPTQMRTEGGKWRQQESWHEWVSLWDSHETKRSGLKKSHCTNDKKFRKSLFYTFLVLVNAN